MSGQALVAAFALAIVSVAPATASDGTAAALKPLRTLVYSVDLTARNSNEEKTSGFLPGDLGAIMAGSATVKRLANVSDSGTLTISVVAATADGGLAVDASFAGKASSQAPIRVAILSDGRLLYDPKTELAPETFRILPLLSRGFVAGRDVSPGSSWTVGAPAPVRGSTTYTVISLQEDQATLSIESDLKLLGPQGYEEHDNGTAKYATDRLCPIMYDIMARLRHQPSSEQYVTTNAHLTATLVSDTFAKK